MGVQLPLAALGCIAAWFFWRVVWNQRSAYIDSCLLEALMGGPHTKTRLEHYVPLVVPHRVAQRILALREAGVIRCRDIYGLEVYSLEDS